MLLQSAFVLGFCHLFAGVALGTLIYKKSGRPIAVLACAIGSILPDIIDKPLGHWILSESLNSGRIYAHTMLFLLITLGVGIAYWRQKSRMSVLAIGGGIGTHLILDEIWQAPVTFFWPFLGPFSSTDFESYFSTFAIYEVSSPSEWMFAIAILYTLTVAYQDKWIFTKIIRVVERTWDLLQAVLISAGGAYIIYAAYASNEENLMIGVTAIIGSIIINYALGNKVTEDVHRITFGPPDEHR